MTNIKFECMWTFIRNNNFGGNNDISEELICTICKGLLVNPHIGLCGCRYCLDCITEYLDGQAKMCPGDLDECKEELIDINENISPDNAINHRIAKCVVKCPHEHCEFEDELRKMEGHERECRTQSVGVSCVNVKSIGTQVVCCDIDPSYHKQQVSWPIPGIGEFEKTMVTTNTAMAQLQSVIKTMILDMNERKEMEERQLREIESLREELEDEQSRGRDRNEVIDWLKDQMTNLKNDQLMAKEENKLLKEKIENCRESCLQLVVPKSGQGELVPFNWTRQLTTISMDVTKQNWGEFVWCIDDWSAKRQLAQNGVATKIYSDTFYSHKNGYKMCLSLYPCGWGAGENTHLSIVFHLMRGPYDNILEWPFKLPVKVALVNQRTRADHVSVTMLFAQFPDHFNWQKPSTDKSAGFAKSKLIELDEISTCPGLCEDDRVFIRCTVATSGYL